MASDSAATERRYVINHRYGLACKDCGARVVDTEAHDKFHDALRRLAHV